MTILLDLVECNNEKGLGPISSSRRIQGLPILIMRSEHESTLQPPSGEAGDMGLVAQTPPPLLPPPHQGRLGRDPLPPSTGHTPPPRKLYSSGISLGENLTSASKSGSEVTVLTQDDSKEHFWLNGTSLRGQTAKIETSAGWLARFSIVLLNGRSGNQAGPVQPGQSHGRPVRNRSLYKESQCTFSSLSINTRRWPHLQTHREETLPMRSEEEQTVVKICRLNSKRTQLSKIIVVFN